MLKMKKVDITFIYSKIVFKIAELKEKKKKKHKSAYTEKQNI